MRLADVLLAYSEWLDTEGLLLMKRGDERTHTDLVSGFRGDVNAGSPLDEVLGVDAVLWEDGVLGADGGEQECGSEVEEDALTAAANVLLQIARGEVRVGGQDAELHYRIQAAEALLGSRAEVSIGFDAPTLEALDSLVGER